MLDRIPEVGKAGRVALIFEGVDPEDPNKTYYFFEHADNATPGTPLNKYTLLQDETAIRLGLNPDDNPTVNDAFLRLAGQYSGGGTWLGSAHLGASHL